MIGLAQLLPSLAFPALAWAGLAAVSVPIAIHLLTRLRRRPVPWGAMRFLMEAFRRHRHRLRVEQLLLLLLRCLILALLGLALSGPILEAGGLGAAGGLGTDRTLLLVLDDSLSTRVRVGDGANRFERLRRTARALVGAMGPADEVAIWRSGRPGAALALPATLDHAVVGQTLDTLNPRYSGSDLAATLRLVAAHLKGHDRPRRQVFLAILSDWARDALNLQQKHDAELADLGEKATLLLSRPMAAADNTQIVSLHPMRHLIVADRSDRASIPVEVTMRRFMADAAATTNRIELSVWSKAGRWAQVNRVHHWSVGERVSVPLNITLQAHLPDVASGGRGLDGRVVVVKATVQTPLGDSLSADDERSTLVQLRRRLSVALIDEAPGNLENEPAPRHWLAAALAPNAGQIREQDDPVSLAYLTASALDTTRLASADAVAVLRPDVLDRGAWSALRAYVDDGGLMTVFAPAIDAPAHWETMLPEVMGVDWQLAMEPIETPDAAPWTLAADQPVPEVFDQLTSDWQALLRPVRVRRRLALTVTGGADAVWLRVGNAQRDPLMAATRVGDGTVVLLATAVSSAWTNLPAKPLWLPLIHETMRGVLGRSGETARLSRVVVADRPVLGRRWSGALRLVAIDGSDAAPQVGVPLEQAHGGLSPTQGFERPGVYTSEPPRGLKLSVNVDPQAADTRSLAEQSVADWFAAWSEPSWLDPRDPAVALTREPPRIDATWPLLWLLLALVVAETCAARWFSHAVASGKRAAEPIVMQRG